ncbi:carboxylating nicotinate-nucleotide diphosphorylase [Corynebacterium ammoniagenes]|uniref:Nicotinate-nucleotide pyrophosphorylase [carboxylating] n=2 Tax=Corynebacterium ammoniagenes TaxID=1697 RepID=A0AAV5GB17_CORAM|nr:carboxylating nicotinate-nucleotide diphosphorylase [Corynebacterium ammoniagenes]APT83590.1 nicotinate-nucleotide pyrophosphorylase [Corynebacterium ammoniagenes DSM 20306]AQS74581.1 nicotinate-nucleotide diphosphorylase (carboxylating) [Corynebacterium ammoniagenes]EFG81028.1 nicotinate-nucleotide diphosphorylase (carboxylating) [Corynebacterium ammoniagenes DSM 20306]NMF32015.1 carboxylating nicotinate-nucleotide diphosphorylase [Corynebacterium ammoniagenes]GJN43275.1 nicotinate-nucleot
MTISLLDSTGLDAVTTRAHIEAALDEDLAWGPDATTNATIGADIIGTAKIVSREPGCLAGVPIAALALQITAERDGVDLDIEVLKNDGDTVDAGQPTLRATGAVRTLLTAERTALNYVSQLSGVATATHAWTQALQGTGIAVRDTRKTVPGLRILQKYAVRCGGGINHRMGLGDSALIKDNHIAATGSLAAAFTAVRSKFPELPVEVECDTLEQVAEAVNVGAELILLDNMAPDVVREAVAITRPAGIRTEASGGITLDSVAAYRDTGVDYIAVGALTHSNRVLDLGFDLA